MLRGLAVGSPWSETACLHLQDLVSPLYSRRKAEAQLESAMLHCDPTGKRSSRFNHQKFVYGGRRDCVSGYFCRPISSEAASRTQRTVCALGGFTLQNWGSACENSHPDEYGGVVSCHVSGTVAIAIRSNTGSAVAGRESSIRGW